MGWCSIYGKQSIDGKQRLFPGDSKTAISCHRDEESANQTEGIPIPVLTNAVVPVGGPNQAYHFNIAGSDGFDQGVDSRIVLAYGSYMSAINSGQGINAERVASVGAVNPYSCHTSVTSVNTEYDIKFHTTSPVYAGQGLHAILDIFGHGNKGVPGIDKFTGIKDDNWDGLAALLGISSHKLNSHDKFDEVDYDWANCTLTKVKYAGRDKNNNPKAARMISAALSSKAYLSSFYYEIS